MVEKIVSGYQQVLDARCYKNEFGEFHREKGPAIIDPDGVLSWYNDGRFVKSINIEDDDTQIESIMNVFDFGRVHLVMTTLNLRYMIGDDIRIPEIVELRLYAQRLLNDCKRFRVYEDYECISSGGFEASACKKGFTLRFIIEQFSTE